MAQENDVCSICLEEVMVNVGRASAKLGCNHLFHLNCIGNAFNTSRRIQCPNCRAVEQEEWVIPLPEDNESNEDGNPRRRRVPRSFGQTNMRPQRHHQEHPQERSGFLGYRPDFRRYTAENLELLPRLSPPRIQLIPYDRPSTSNVAGNMEAGSSRGPQLNLDEADTEAVPTSPHSDQSSDTELSPYWT